MKQDVPVATFTPLRVTAQPLHERVVQQVVQQIVGGMMPPGTTLPPEPELAQQFGVSRTVIREAVRVLVAKGLIAVRHGSGMCVQPTDAWNYLDSLILFEWVRSGHGDDMLDELLEVRRVLETEVAALAAQRRTSHDLQQLHITMACMRAGLGDPHVYTRLDIVFHEQILAAARNRLLREALRPVAEAIRAGRFLTAQRPSGAQESMHGPEQIYAAIVDNDAEGARAAMRQHVEQFERDIHRSLHTSAYGSTLCDS